MKKNNILIFLFLILNFCAYSQNETHYDTYILNNYEFGKVLNEFIEHEKQYDYFNKNCMFSISIYKQITEVDTAVNFMLASGLPIEEWEKENTNSKYSILKFYNYYFVLINKDNDDIFSNSTIFEKVDCKLDFSVSQGHNYAYTETLEIGGKDSQGNLLGIDTHERKNSTYWFYQYYRGNFYEVSKLSRNYGYIK